MSADQCSVEPTGLMFWWEFFGFYRRRRRRRRRRWNYVRDSMWNVNVRLDLDVWLSFFFIIFHHYISLGTFGSCGRDTYIEKETVQMFSFCVLPAPSVVPYSWGIFWQETHRDKTSKWIPKSRTESAVIALICLHILCNGCRDIREIKRHFKKSRHQSNTKSKFILLQFELLPR